jgi:group II intron reverse transcriptase/maturase
MAEMLPTMKVLARIRNNSSSNNNEVFTRLYRYLLRPDVYFEAYKHLYANKGAATKGINNDTADGFSEEKIYQIIESLTDESYSPTPVRRTYINKQNSSKKRPLGIPTFTDKLVQEALRMVIEAVYEPIFMDCSHGFRPNKSCHTALKDITKGFNGVRWFIEGDIRGCFDNIDHNVLIGLINQKIKDAKIIKLIYKFLKAGYLENWQYYNTYSGTPQGGIISPLLANIYLHELDKYVMKVKSEYDIPPERVYTPEYSKLQWKLVKLKTRIDKSEYDERANLLNEYERLHALMLKTPSKSQTDKKIKYIRYADDFLIGVNGSKEDCAEIKQRLSDFISSVLKMELSVEKTLITHSNQKARFLGYDVRVRRNSQIKSDKNGIKKRSLNNMAELTVPFIEKINTFLFRKSIAEQQSDGTLLAVCRPFLLHMTELEIVSTYNAELRGICNYYNKAADFYKLSYFAYLMEYSCLKTIAAKHRTSISKLVTKYKDGKGKWGVPYSTKSGMKRCYFANYTDSKKFENPSDTKPINERMHRYSKTSFEIRLQEKTCELCGATDKAHYEIHHVHKIKDLKGHTPWEIAMIAKKRKTLIVCRECHHSIHD